MKVAWHEMSGNLEGRRPCRRVRYDPSTLGVLLHWVMNETGRRRSYRPYETDPYVAAFPGTSCQATIIESLRDKTRVKRSYVARVWGLGLALEKKLVLPEWWWFRVVG